MSTERERLPFTLPFLNRRTNGSNSRSGQSVPGSGRCSFEHRSTLDVKHERNNNMDQWDR